MTRITIRDNNPAILLTLDEARAAKVAMREEDIYELICRRHVAEDALAEASSQFDEWFRKKGQLAARILELEREQKAAIPPTPATVADSSAPEAK